MPRPPSGPRRIDSSGTYYAVKSIAGKKHYISLQTKVKSEAMRRWPAAQAELEQLASPKKIAWNTPVQSPWGGEEEAQFVLQRDEVEWEAESNSVISWSRAIEIAEKRFQRRRGKSVSRGWRYNITNGLKHLTVKYPLDMTPADVRKLVDTMESKGYKDSTIAIQASAVSGVIEALIKGGYAGNDFSNPFLRVDTAAVSTTHFYKAVPEDYKTMILDSFYLHVLVYTGARISEVCKGDYSESGWLKIGKDIAKNKASIREVPLPNWLDIPTESVGKDAFRNQFNRNKSNQSLTPHSFRHGWKSAARMAAADEITAERLLGHSVGKMNSVYGIYPRAALLREAEKVWQVIDQWRSQS